MVIACGQFEGFIIHALDFSRRCVKMAHEIIRVLKPISPEMSPVISQTLRNMKFQTEVFSSF